MRKSKRAIETGREREEKKIRRERGRERERKR